MPRPLLFAVCIFLAGLSTPRASAALPNFLLIYADDHGYGDTSAYRPDGDIRTPHIDRIGSEGIRFVNMRANCTVCSPSRAALLTGRYPDRVGVPGVIRTKPEDSWGYLAPGVPTLADELGKAGYDTGIVGKWHLGLESPNLPNERGFRFFHGFLGDMMDSYTTHLRHGNNYLRKNSETIEAEGHATDLFTDWAIAYLKERAASKSQPFFLYLAYNAPHFPIEPPADWLAKVRERDPDMDPKRAANVALVEHLDFNVGRLLDALDELGLAKDILLVYGSDNGGSLPHAQNNDPWRDGKTSHYDGGFRVPFLMRWPEKIAPGSLSDYQGQNFDLFPTFLELAGSKSSAPEELDAVSLVPILEGKTMPEGRELYFVRREGGRGYGGKSYEAIIRDGWKLMQNSPYGPLELYHLAEDPQETTDLAGKAPEVFNDLADALRLHVQKGGSVPWQKPQTTP